MLKKPANKETKLLSVRGAKRRLTNKLHRSVKEARLRVATRLHVQSASALKLRLKGNARRSGCSKLNLNLVSITLTVVRLGSSALAQFSLFIVEKLERPAAT